MPGILEQYATPKEEAEVRTVKIINELGTSHYKRDPENLIYNDAEHRDLHIHMINTFKEIVLWMKNATTLAQAFVQTISGKHPDAEPTPKKAIFHSTTSQTSSSTQANSQSQQVDQQSVGINFSAQQKAHEKGLEFSAFKRQQDEAQRTRFHIHSQAHNILIEQLRNQRTGGPPPDQVF